MKTHGIRRSEEELARFKEEKLGLKFNLVEQTSFTGSQELLERMQSYERSYREGKPQITDEEWDKLVKETGYIESLDQVVSPSGRKWVKMGAPLVSLKKIDTMEAITKMVEGKPSIIAPKLDGLTYTAFYGLTEEGSLELRDIGTRGDGVYSLILHPGALEGVDLKWLPKYIDADTTAKLDNAGCIINGVFELRGEAVIDKYEYTALNNLDVETLVPRSIAAGIFNRVKTSSLDHFKKELWNALGNPVVDSLDESVLSEVEKRHTKESKKSLGAYKLVSRGSDRESVIVVEYKGELSLISRYKDRGYVVETGPIGALRIETLYMISFSVASIYGNIDRPEIIRMIPGAKYIGDIEDFKDMYAITDSAEVAIQCVDNLYGTVQGVRDMSKERQKITSRFALDGMVIKPLESNKDTQGLISEGKNGSIVIKNKPADQVAVKLPTDPVVTKILKIIKTKTSLGNVTVRADIEPVVAEGGATVKSVNLHNENWLSQPENSWIQEGVECLLYLSMDIIPVLAPIDKYS